MEIQLNFNKVANDEIIPSIKEASDENALVLWFIKLLKKICRKKLKKRVLLKFKLAVDAYVKDMDRFSVLHCQFMNV